MYKYLLSILTPALLLASGFGLAVRSQTSSDITTTLPRLTFSVSGCEDDFLRSCRQKQLKNEFSPRDIRVEVKKNVVSFSHSLGYACCADIQLESQVNNNIITIVERNSGSYCRCSCNYTIDGTLTDLAPGNYELQVYGMKYRDRGKELLFVENIAIE
ncbi:MULTISPECIES: hypothetical protein [Spirulina sp. CCY15215]|uniref:hypothetical protein n=1 Tax=Spirulina sp. CCY15215 TaxID=2767591 RepID=UPI00195147B7|nr:hypothetical protein [Spirulina major]